MNIPIVADYNLYTFMWEKFGYRAHEVEELDMRFVNSMAAVASAESRVTRERMEQGRN